MSQRSTATFQTPFSRAYWALACGELKNVRILVLAAMITALRIAVKGLDFPLGPNLNVTVGFFVNATGSMIYGPVVGAVAGAISDTIGYFMAADRGPYFFPFMFSEMLSSVLFGVFLYRAKLSTGRVVLSRFSVTLICNLLLDPLLLYWQYMWLGADKTFFGVMVSVPRLLKNIVMFPAQTVLLILLLGVVSAVTVRFKLTFSDGDRLKISKRHIIGVVVLTLVAIAMVAVWFIWLYPMLYPNR